MTINAVHQSEQRDLMNYLETMTGDMKALGQLIKKQQSMPSLNLFLQLNRLLFTSSNTTGINNYYFLLQASLNYNVQ